MVKKGIINQANKLPLERESPGTPTATEYRPRGRPGEMAANSTSFSGGKPKQGRTVLMLYWGRGGGSKEWGKLQQGESV